MWPPVPSTITPDSVKSTLESFTGNCGAGGGVDWGRLHCWHLGCARMRQGAGVYVHGCLQLRHTRGATSLLCPHLPRLEHNDRSLDAVSHSQSLARVPCLCVGVGVCRLCMMCVCVCVCVCVVRACTRAPRVRLACACEHAASAWRQNGSCQRVCPCPCVPPNIPLHSSRLAPLLHPVSPG